MNRLCLLRANSMGSKKTLPNPLPDEEKRRQLDEAFRNFAVQLGVDPDLLDSNIRFGPSSELSPEQQHELAKAKGLQIVLESVLSGIRTEVDLQQALQTILARTERASTVAREAMDQIRADLPRRGGPGRGPKLDRRESTIVCKEILKLVGVRKYRLKDALSEVSKMCPEILHKTVSPRTLQKAWDKRDEFLAE